jgi:hypothetical protein
MFTAQQDIEMGKMLTAEAESMLWFSTDQWSHGYINALGDQLSAHAPGYQFPYEFRIVDDDRINSWALPGGLIYVTKGLVLAAESEPELAGLLAHQIAHVALRHGTQQVTQAWGTPSSGSARVSVPTVMSQLNINFDSGGIPLKFSAEEERQADLIGAQILYDARFDPRQMPLFFQKIGNEPVNLQSEFFDRHPGVTNRTVRVRRELQAMGGLRTNLRGDSPDLHKTQDNLRAETSGFIRDDDSRGSRTPELPSSRMLSYRGNDFDFQYPDNWDVSEDGVVLTVAPYEGIVSGSLAYGMSMGTFDPLDSSTGQTQLNVPGASQRGTSLSRATEELIADLRRSNPNMRVIRNTERRRVDGANAMITELSNDSPVGSLETDWMVTVLRPDGRLNYFVGVAPERDFSRYLPTFQRIIDSVRFYD